MSVAHPARRLLSRGRLVRAGLQDRRFHGLPRRLPQGRTAQPVILEPIMKVSVIVPEEYTGDVIGDISARRGNVLGMIPRLGSSQIDAHVPLSEMFGYATDLRSKTQGRGAY